jgi:hypothetical protein
MPAIIGITLSTHYLLAPIAMSFAMLAYWAAGSVRHDLWLLTLPTLLPVIRLAPWSVPIGTEVNPPPPARIPANVTADSGNATGIPVKVTAGVGVARFDFMPACFSGRFCLSGCREQTICPVL